MVGLGQSEPSPKGQRNLPALTSEAFTAHRTREGSSLVGMAAGWPVLSVCCGSFTRMPVEKAETQPFLSSRTRNCNLLIWPKAVVVALRHNYPFLPQDSFSRTRS